MGKYQIDISKAGLLGEGTSCVCRQGRLVETGGCVAIKVYKPATNAGAFDADVCLMKFKRSIAVLQKLQEPFERPQDPKLWTPQLEHVKPSRLFMRLLDYSKDLNGEPSRDASDGNLYVITELGQQSLKDFMTKKRAEMVSPSKETVRSITKAIVLVMAGLHAKGLVHMDVKPENLMVFDGCLKLIDVDGCVEIGSKVSLQDPSISFSPIYCAPEWATFLLEGQESGIEASAGLDSWSVGCTICELVTLDGLMRPTYAKMAREDRRRGPANFMDWLRGLEEPPLPRAVKQYDDELLQLMTGCLLVCDKSERSSCAETLDSPYLASHKLQRTKTNPLFAAANRGLSRQSTKEVEVEAERTA